MKFSINRKLFSENLAEIMKVVPNRSTMPILGNILFNLEENKLSLRSSDIEVSMETGIEVKGQESGKVAIPADFLQSLVNELEDEFIDISVNENYKVVIESNLGDYEINGRSPEEFPSLPKIEEPKEIEMDKQNLGRMITKALVAVGQDELKPAFLGVLFQIHANDLKLVSSDVHRLVFIKNDSFTSDHEDHDIIIPTKFLNILTGYLTEEGKISLTVGKNHVKVKFDSKEIYSRLIDEKFPEYENYIPDDNDKIALFDAEALRSTLKRVSIFSDKKTHEISVNFYNDTAKVETLNREQSTSAEEFVDISYQDEPLKIGFNAKYFMEMLNNIDTKKAMLKMDSKLTANLLLPEQQEENEELKMIVMPIRLEDDEEEEINS
ncbi:MAG: DNA polymerase III subunit beta [Candidatus Marinimicrobia bacterium]|nr:DNA polymerase III subunit beta [Candidatus Neomarinimicrobiota bacterium]